MKRYLIIDKKHSWYGNAGILGKELSNMPGMFRLELDNGMAAGVYKNQIKEL